MRVDVLVVKENFLYDPDPTGSISQMDLDYCPTKIEPISVDVIIIAACSRFCQQVRRLWSFLRALGCFLALVVYPGIPITSLNGFRT